MSNDPLRQNRALPTESDTRAWLTDVPEERLPPRWAERLLTESMEQAAAPLPAAAEDPQPEAVVLPVGPPVASPEAHPGIRLGSLLRETLETILLALLIFVTVRAVIQNFKVEGSSMEPNLHSGQYLLVNKAAYLAVDLSTLAEYLPQGLRPGVSPVLSPFGEPQRGDVVVFRYPRDPRRDFIKRIVAVPGDTVTIQQGRVVVNGAELHEPYIIENTGYSREPVVVAPGHYYVLGDNRNNSSDSHVWGPVPQENIVGKAWLSYWPLSEWGLAPNYPVAAGNK